MFNVKKSISLIGVCSIIVGGTFTGVIQDGNAPRIMCIGDSITVGVYDFPTTPSSYLGYRDNLQDKLGLSSYRFVGDYGVTHYSKTDAADYRLGWDDSWRRVGDGYQTRHQAIWGGHLSDYTSNIDEILDRWMRAPNPEGSSILIHLGTNDSGSDSETITGYMESVLLSIHEHDPLIDIYLAKIIPKASSINDIVEYNADLEEMVDSFKTNYSKDNIYIVDMYSDFIANENWVPDYSTDGIHPNSVGYEIMATKWYEAILSNK